MVFPHPQLANADGLLAIGGDLSVPRLLLAYRYGIFPWYSEGQPIQWWSPDPRCVLFPDKLNISKSMRSLFRKRHFNVTFDHAFASIIEACQSIPRSGQSGTWITDAMKEAYIELHRLGYAHSVEVWHGTTLAGGLYGISLGKVFFGESMFSHQSNASKYGLISLVKELEGQSFSVIDCQQDTPHLRSLGAETITRSHFLEILRANNLQPDQAGNWSGLIPGSI